MADYWLLWLVLLANVAYFIWKQNWIKAGLVAGWSFGFVLLVNVPFYEAVGQQFYMENLYLPLAVFAAIPFVFEVLSTQTKNDRLATNGAIALGILFAINLLRIGQAQQIWAAKLHWEQAYLQSTANFPKRKLVLADKDVPMDVLKMSWGSPYEFLMLSSLENPDSARCIIISDDANKFDPQLAEPRLFLGSFKNYPFEDLPQRYFRIRDTLGYVRVGRE
jgi:hypothetical protein